VKDRGFSDEMLQSVVEDYGYSQKQLADHLGVHYSTISRLMNRLPDYAIFSASILISGNIVFNNYNCRVQPNTYKASACQ